jgi:hypothetical protein
MKSEVFVLCILIGFMLMGCPRDKEKSKVDGKSEDTICVFDAKLIELKTPHELFKDKGWGDFDEGWNDFMYVCKYQVVKSTYEYIEDGTIYAVIISKTDVVKPSFTKTDIGDNVKFEKDVVHRLTVTAVLPKGWDALKDGFSEDWPVFCACVKVEMVNSK